MEVRQRIHELLPNPDPRASKLISAVDSMPLSPASEIDQRVSLFSKFSRELELLIGTHYLHKRRASEEALLKHLQEVLSDETVSD
jgi:hypothetical protein